MPPPPEVSTKALYVQVLPYAIFVYLPEEYTVTDPIVWSSVIEEYLKSSGYQVERAISVEDAKSGARSKSGKVLKVFYEPKVGATQHNLSNERLVELLDTKYITAVHSRIQNFFDNDGDRVASQVHLAVVNGAPHNIAPSDLGSWCRKHSITYKKSERGSSHCFTLPADMDPDKWQFSITDSLGAFVLREKTNWG